MPEFDPSLKTIVTSKRERERIMRDKGLADIRDWNDPSKIKTEAERNRADLIEKQNRYLEDPVKRALEKAERGEEFQPELEARLSEERDRQMKADDERWQREAENRAEERAREERDRR